MGGLLKIKVARVRKKGSKRDGWGGPWLGLFESFGGSGWDLGTILGSKGSFFGSSFSGRKKRIEHTINYFGRDTATIILNGYMEKRAIIAGGLNYNLAH